MATGRVELGPATYDVVIDGTPDTVTVPTLTSGSIAQATPTEGDTLTVTGSNASATATFQWQKDSVDISGATSASLDTTGEGAGGYRRGVSDGTQGPTYTAAVTVSAGAAPGLATFIDVAEPDSVVGTEHTWSGVTLGTGRIWVAVTILDSAANFGTGPIQIDGSNATYVDGNTDGNASTLWYRRDVTSATGDIVVDRGQNYDKGIVIRWWRTATSVTNAASVSWSTFNFGNVNVLDEDHVIAAGGGYTTSSGTLSVALTNMTAVSGSPIDTLSGVGGEAANIWGAEHIVTADETPRTLTAAPTPAYEHNANRALVLRDA